jgi:hypothetical protein
MQNNCELHSPLELDTWEAGEDRKTIAHREREHNHFLILYDVKQVQTAEVSQRRTAVSSKCFQLYYTCSDTLLTVALPSYSFHLFPPLTVTFPKLAVILRPVYIVVYVWRVFLHPAGLLLTNAQLPVLQCLRKGKDGSKEPLVV